MPEILARVLAHWEGDRDQSNQSLLGPVVEQVLLVLALVVEQGDVDDMTVTRLRSEVVEHAAVSGVDSTELLRTARLELVEALTTGARAADALGSEDRWQIQLETASFCSELLEERSLATPGAVERVLVELEESGPDRS